MSDFDVTLNRKPAARDTVPARLEPPVQSQAGTSSHWVDVVTLAAPRPTISRSIHSLLSTMDRGAIRLRWIVHLDWIDCLADDFDDCVHRILSLAQHFDSMIFMATHPNLGQPESFIRCIRHVANDFLYWEDDKVCVQPFSLEELVHSVGDHLSLQGRCGRPGHTSASFWRKRIAKRIVKRWPPPDPKTRLETWLKRLCRKSRFKAGTSRYCAVDVGLEHLSERGIVRQRGGDGNPRYASRPMQVTYATFLTESHLEVFLSRFPKWCWCLCIQSFPLLVLYAEDVEPPASVVSAAVAVRRDQLPDQLDDANGYLCFLQRLSNVSTDFVCYLHPTVNAGRHAAALDFGELLQFDLLGDPTRSRYVGIVRTQWLRTALAHYRSHPSPEHITCFLWTFAIATKANYRQLELSELGLST